MNDSYSDIHRQHMQYEIQRQDREWKRLNVHKDRYDTTPLQRIVGTLIIICISTEVAWRIALKVHP